MNCLATADRPLGATARPPGSLAEVSGCPLNHRRETRACDAGAEARNAIRLIDYPRTGGLHVVRRVAKRADRACAVATAGLNLHRYTFRAAIREEVDLRACCGAECVRRSLRAMTSITNPSQLAPRDGW